MDDSKFLSVFSRLQSRDKTLLRDSIQQLLDFLAKAQAAGRTEERSYALTRLTKGLASALHEVKVGFSMALTALLRAFPDIDPLALYRGYKALDQSISSAHSLRLGQVTLIACCFRARPSFTNKEVEKDLLELFGTKRDTAEAVSEVILLCPQAQALIGKLEDQNDVNYLRLAYERLGAVPAVVSQAVKAKTTILEGTLTTLPRLHSVWTPVLTAAYQTRKLATVWKQFVEMGIQQCDKHKKKVKFVSLGLALLSEILARDPLLLGDALTPLFLKCWQEQCSHKNSRLYEEANATKALLYSTLQAQDTTDYSAIAKAVSDIAKTVSGSEILMRLAEFVATKGDAATAKTFCEDAMESGSEQLTACVLHRLSKREEAPLRAFATELLTKLVIASPGAVPLKGKLMDTLAAQSLDEVRTALCTWTASTDLPVQFRKLGKSLLKRMKPFFAEEKSVELSRKKRKRENEEVFTAVQLQSLIKLAAMRLIAATHSGEDPPAEVLELMEVAEQLQVPTPRTDSQGPEGELFDLILKCTSDALLREPTKATFKEFVDELPDSYAQKLATMLTSLKSPLSARPDPKDVLGDDVELDLSDELPQILSEPGKAVSFTVCESDVLHASDLAEVIIKRSSNQRHLVLIGKSLVLGLRKGSDNVKNRFRALLQKFSKGTISVTADNFDEYSSLLSLILALSRKDGSMFAQTKSTAVALCKKLAEFNPIDTSDLFLKVLKDALEKHGSKASFEQLKQFLTQVPKCCNSEVFEYLAGAATTPHSHFIQVQSLELLKVAARKQAPPQSVLKMLTKHARKMLKGALDTKQAHNDLKLLLSTILTACKKSSFTHRRLQRVCEAASSKCQGVMSILSVVGELQKHIHDIENRA